MSTAPRRMLSIGEAAARFGLAPHVLRHWESAGLLAPARVRGDRRRYGDEDLYRMALILRAKEAGFTLDDIRDMLAVRHPAERREILRRHHAALARRIAEARAALDLIETALDCSHADVTECPHFRAAARTRAGLTPAGPPHPPGEECHCHPASAR
ncbi:hypothetical protein Sru01_37470 [Sphaerisporangium rufum]|uniref:HTH merR-type domain-containing protein n=1 Tax=Sphaerisporangium rufum TaxID=1381558 RepID=A0A919V5X2_9ACTN|nr:MerR family transcriptional regulator [Sphaerisporangium rufum]GII78765.1 hypothetical protein Sru01_37470 [Sphaerisporangium rufum]